MTSFVYQLVPVNPEDISERYIGSTRNLNRRISTHYAHAKRLPELCKSSILINKYGKEGVKFEILEVVLLGVNLKEREQHYIEALPNINGMPAHKTAEQKAETRKVINARYRESQNYQVDCECGGTYSYANRHCHFKKKMHLEYVEKQSSV